MNNQQSQKMPEHFKFFQNTACEYFPCHSGIPKEEFNCLFCYCPLYFLHRACGGNCQFTKHDIKDCSNCTVPHGKNSYDIITRKISEAIKKQSNSVEEETK